MIAEHVEQIRLADELGFDAVWLTEHHFSSVPPPSETRTRTNAGR